MSWQTRTSAPEVISAKRSMRADGADRARMMVGSPPRQFVGGSAAIAAVREIAESIAARRSTVMILGETGSGKEMLARHVHDLSDRRGAPFIPVDCSALTDTL